MMVAKGTGHQPLCSALGECVEIVLLPVGLLGLGVWPPSQLPSISLYPLELLSGGVPETNGRGVIKMTLFLSLRFKALFLRGHGSWAAPCGPFVPLLCSW